MVVDEVPSSREDIMIVRILNTWPAKIVVFCHHVGVVSSLEQLECYKEVVEVCISCLGLINDPCDMQWSLYSGSVTPIIVNDIVSTPAENQRQCERSIPEILSSDGKPKASRSCRGNHLVRRTKSHQMWGSRNNHNDATGKRNHNADVATDDAQNSVFGDGYSIQSRKSTLTNRLQSDLEADYDQGATFLYRAIEEKDWDAALSRLNKNPDEARTWVSRREPGSSKTRWRLLPLHAVCIFRAPLSLLEALIEAYEEGPQMKDDQGMLPVHLACRNGASKGVVLTLLAAFPESIYIRDRKKRSLHDLVGNSTSVNKESVLAAIDRFESEVAGLKDTKSTASHSASSKSAHLESSTREVDYENRTLLFRYILKKDWKAAAKRTRSHPEEAATWIVTKGFNGNLRFLPLHKACVLQPPISVVQALVEAYPAGVLDKDQDGWLAVHCACFYGASEPILALLLEAYPKGAHAKDDEGRLPIHYACLKGASQSVVDTLLAAYAKGAGHKDDEGRLPIHHACSKSAPETIIDALLRAYPKGAQSKDDQGRLALHHACRKSASERVVRTLLRVYPRAAQIKDDQDKLPIHYACQHGSTSTAVAHLLTAYPESVSVKNGFGQTPLDDARDALHNGNQQMDTVIKVLCKAQKENEKHGNTLNIDGALKDKIAFMENRIETLEATLGKVGALGKDMKVALRKKKSSSEILDRFADELIQVGRGKQSSSPSRVRSVTPASLFSRSNNNLSRPGKMKA